jgi:hypothetical protein
MKSRSFAPASKRDVAYPQQMLAAAPLPPRCCNFCPELLQFGCLLLVCRFPCRNGRMPYIKAIEGSCYLTISIGFIDFI